MSFLSVFWYIFIAFLFFAWLVILFQIIGDLFRDHTMGGFAKAIWVIALVFLPFLTMFIYLIARGKGMAERQQAAIVDMKQQQDEYIKSVAGTSSADQISQAKALLDAGTISQAEFDALKAKALG
jgi:hypothetical protein